MFHAVTSDSKQQADVAKTNPPLQREDAHPTFDGSHALGMPPVAVRGLTPPAPVSPRKQKLMRLQRAYGNQAVLRMLQLSRRAIQSKLVVNEPGDAYEQEADRVADQVMRVPDPDLSIAPAPALVSRKCAACEEEDNKKLQMKPAGSPETTGDGVAPPIVHEVLRSPGQPLDPTTRAFFEPRFGYDFSEVRVHTDENAAASARAVGALAYTVGAHIAFAGGSFAPSSDRGRLLAAHELAHVVQQGQGDPAATLHRAHTDPATGRQAFDCPDYAGDPKLEACLNDEDRLRPGDRGETVAKFQRGLLNDGADLGPTGADGSYGSHTAQAVMAFKRKYQLGFEQYADVGPGTMAKLDSLCAQPRPMLSVALKAGLLSQITSASLNIGPNPHVVRQPTDSKVQITITKPFTAEGKAHVSGPDAASFEFGFLQLCRPFEVERATYHESGAPPGPGKDLIRDGSTKIRSVQPVLDYGTSNFPWTGTPAKGPDATVKFWDFPAMSFERNIGKNDVSYDLSGVFSLSFFFTAFAVKTPDGVYRALQTFYWGFGGCEEFPAGTDLSKPEVWQPVDHSPVRDCRKGPCDESEPGFSKVNGPAGDNCNKVLNDAWDRTDFKGPGTFSIGCGT